MAYRFQMPSARPTTEHDQQVKLWPFSTALSQALIMLRMSIRDGDGTKFFRS